jgi:predicted flap endonuclease-1-like 5' DNA nuclease
MPYTLMKGLGWFVAALLLGIMIGWLLRSIAATRQMRRMRAVRADHTELDRLRARNANLEPVVAERDRLAAALAARNAPPAAPAAAVEDTVDLAVAEADIAAELEADTVTDTGVDAAAEDDVATEPEFTELNLVAASAVIGKKVKLDDLTAIEGIGPAIATLCHNIGIHTWADMAATEVSLLRTMLADAGTSSQMHDPASWPEQAGLLATGQWEAFTTLIASLGSDRPTE